MYRSAADALLVLIDGGPPGRCKITSMSPTIVRMNNGIKYFAVEVTAGDGAQYGISAFDKEAEELYEVATSRTASKRVGEPIAISAE